MDAMLFRSSTTIHTVDGRERWNWCDEIYTNGVRNTALPAVRDDDPTKRRPQLDQAKKLLVPWIPKASLAIRGSVRTSFTGEVFDVSALFSAAPW